MRLEEKHFLKKEVEMIFLGLPGPTSRVETTDAPARRCQGTFPRPSTPSSLGTRSWLGHGGRVLPRCPGHGAVGPLELEEVDEVLRGHGREAAVRVSSRAGVARVLREEWVVTTRGVFLEGTQLRSRQLLV